MTRPFFQVYGANTISKGKWRRANLRERGALVTLWMAASLQEDEGYWPDREALIDDVDDDDAPAIVDRLIALRWIDATAEGLFIHDWPQWQPPLPKSGRQRTREWRRRLSTDGGGNPVDNVTKGDAKSSQPSPVTLGEDRREERTGLSTREERSSSGLPARPRAPARGNGAPQSIGDVLSSLQVGPSGPSLTGDEGSDRQSSAVDRRLQDRPKTRQRASKPSGSAAPSDSDRVSRAEPGERLAEPDLTFPDGPGSEGDTRDV